LFRLLELLLSLGLEGVNLLGSVPSGLLHSLIAV
jgi:hypothetical protein